MEWSRSLKGEGNNPGMVSLAQGGGNNNNSLTVNVKVPTKALLNLGGNINNSLLVKYRIACCVVRIALKFI